MEEQVAYDDKYRLRDANTLFNSLLPLQEIKTTRLERLGQVLISLCKGAQFRWRVWSAAVEEQVAYDDKYRLRDANTLFNSLLPLQEIKTTRLERLGQVLISLCKGAQFRWRVCSAAAEEQVAYDDKYRLRDADTLFNSLLPLQDFMGDAK